MKIPGSDIAEEIKVELQSRILALNKQNVIPKLAIILIGDDPGSTVYVHRKQKLAEGIGALTKLYQFPAHTPAKKIVRTVASLNADPSVHGIIIQRPAPIQIPPSQLDALVTKEKDVDGFAPGTKFDPPVALAVDRILKWVWHEQQGRGVIKNKIHEYSTWLAEKKIMVIGRGETAGKPVARFLVKKGIPVAVAHSQTKNIEDMMQNSDIIISCVGRPNIVRHNTLKSGAVLIGVGLHPENNHLKPDYDEEEISSVASFYTPVPGGVGPINVAYLFSNLVKSAEIINC